MVDEKDVSQQIYGQLVMRVWSDPEFKKRLSISPRETLKEIGLELPPDLELEVHIQTPKHIHLVIPEKPPELGELTEEEMRKFAGGATQESSFSSLFFKKR